LAPAPAAAIGGYAVKYDNDGYPDIMPEPTVTIPCAQHEALMAAEEFVRQYVMAADKIGERGDTLYGKGRQIIATLRAAGIGGQTMSEDNPNAQGDDGRPAWTKSHHQRAMSGHTPGPWFSDGLGWIRNSTETIAALNLIRDEQWANARLITAAPDLLEALRDMVHFAGLISSGDEFPEIERARAAIAKATGEVSR